ncbi:hypothetical protein EVAR_58098_1 [Eumeta japonica]|uniref:Uncharacterized protein n=1 Tax=Eumeta variegata TaxID=151549 RepID=A0A4C1YNV2_EUMVA|nr:hypothetical protein EVAR_58098_1 [Eumeta japonica]
MFLSTKQTLGIVYFLLSPFSRGIVSPRFSQFPSRRKQLTRIVSQSITRVVVSAARPQSAPAQSHRADVRIYRVTFVFIARCRAASGADLRAGVTHMRACRLAAANPIV